MLLISNQTIFGIKDTKLYVLGSALEGALHLLHSHSRNYTKLSGVGRLKQSYPTHPPTESLRTLLRQNKQTKSTHNRDSAYIKECPNGKMTKPSTFQHIYIASISENSLATEEENFTSKEKIYFLKSSRVRHLEEYLHGSDVEIFKVTGTAQSLTSLRSDESLSQASSASFLKSETVFQQYLGVLIV